MTRHLKLSFALLLVPIFGIAMRGQTTVNTSQQVILQGLRTNAGHGSFNAAAYAADESLYLLLDEGDGVRILKTDAKGANVLAEAQVGARGDVGISMAVDHNGNIYVAGTTGSGALVGSTGAAFPNTADASTNSFVAKYDANLNLIFLTFLGAGRTAVSSVAATADSVFMTGITFSSSLPVTGAGIQQKPASGSSENGFVERISADGTTLMYATYLTGLGGNTVPAAIVADVADDAYVTGSTSASGFPTVNALQPEMLLVSGVTSSSFLTKLNPAGSAFVFSTFIAGAGVSGMALDASTSALLLTGSVSMGQFPVATVAMPLTSASYQTLLRVAEDGQSVRSSVLLTAGTQSFVSAGASGDAWVSGAVGTPMFPGVAQPDYSAGDSFLLHVTAANGIDQTMRFGGLAKNNLGYAAMSSTVGAPAISGTSVALPGMVSLSVSASLLGTETFVLPMAGTPNAVLPNTLRDVVPSAAACGSSSVCTGTGALLAMVSTAGGVSLGVSTDGLPNVTVTNLGSATATGLLVTATGYAVATNCGATLLPSNQCSVALGGGGPGTLTVSAANATAQTITLGTTSVATDAIVLSTDEVDMGIVSGSDVATYTIAVTNLSAVAQTFSSIRDSVVSPSYGLDESASDCIAGSAAGAHVLAAGASCHVTLGLSGVGSSGSDAPVRAAWKIGQRDVVVTGYLQAAALNVSSAEIDFGTQIAGGVKMPRYLYVSNNSQVAVEHADVALPSSSPFTVIDNCPETLEPKSVCQLQLGYAASGTSSDSVVLTLDHGISVLVTGETLPAASVSGASANPSLSVSVAAVNFATAVNVTGVSNGTQPVMLTNSGTSSMALAISNIGDFTVVNGCPVTLGAGASCTLLVGFAPSQPGLRQGLLSVVAGSGFAPVYVALSGTGRAILPANNGLLELGQTLIGEPIVGWYKVQQSLPSLTATVNGTGFNVALVEDSGSGHGVLPTGSFGANATGACVSCWLGVQYLSQSAQTQSAALTLTTVAAGTSYALTVEATSLPVQGLLLTPAMQDFGAVGVGSSSAAKVLTVVNLLNPNAPVSVQSVSVSGDFAVAAYGNGGAACNGIVAATASCYAEIVFSPTAVGSRAGTLTVVTSGGVITAALAGYGLSGLGLAMSPSALTFAAVPGSSATSQSITLTNAGSTALTIGALTSSNLSFAVSSTCGTLGVGASCNVAITFTPQSSIVAGAMSVPVSQIVNGQAMSATYSVALAGAYTLQDAGLQIVSDEVNYGAVAAGSVGGTREYTLNNLSGKALNVVLQLPRQFPLASDAPCLTLAASASCSFSVSFVPVTAGALTGSVFARGVSSDGLTNAEALAYMLGYGTGSGVLTITGNLIPNAPLSFGQVSSGQTTKQVLTLTNTGSGALTVRRLSSAPPFLSTSNCAVTLAVNASCSVTITYAPVDEVVSGSSLGSTRNDVETLSIESDAAASPQFIAMSGLVLPVASNNPASSAVLATYELSGSALTFANTQVGNAAATQAVTLTNTGTATIHVLSILTAADFTANTTCGAVLPGASCGFNVAFTPTDASNAALRTRTLEISSDATNSLEYISLLGGSSAAPIVLSPATVSFGTVNVGSSETASVSVTNTSSAPVTFTSLSASGAFTVASGTCPATGATIAAGSSCNLVVTFTPVGSGVLSGTLSLSTDATQLPLTIYLSGTAAAAQLQVTPGVLVFGSVGVGVSSSLTLTLINTGTTALTGIAGAISGGSLGDFAVTVPCSVKTLAPGQGCAETVTFTPGAAGIRSAVLTIASSDASGPAIIALSGTGVAVTGTFTLTVSGGSTSTLTVTSGSPATYPLTVTPTSGYTGAVALTCVAITPGRYASCSLLAPLLTLGPTQNTTVTISTIAAAVSRGNGVAAWLLLAPLAMLRRRRLPGRWMMLVLFGTCLGAVACGKTAAPTVDSSSSVVKTPAGTYQYQVTASSTSGSVVSSTVTLTMVVQ